MLRLNITNNANSQTESVQALQYLANTDWYVIRNQELGTAIPQEILDDRAAARLLVD